MLDQYDFLVEEGFKGISEIRSGSLDQIEEMIDLWIDLEGEIPPEQKYGTRTLQTTPIRMEKTGFKLRMGGSGLPVCRAWWLENARIRYNNP